MAEQGDGDPIAALQRRVEMLEAQLAKQREETRAMFVEVLYELRDDTDFNRPVWANALAHVADHLGTDEGKRVARSHGFTSLAEWWVAVQMKLILNSAGRWLLVITIIAAMSGLMLWLGSSGLLFKASGLKQ